MNKLSIVNEGAGRFIVDGDLTFLTIDKKTASGFAFLASAKQITMDLGGLGNADSAGLALMLEWIKQARQKKVQLQFKNIPEQLLNLAKLSGLNKLSHFAENS
jgi:phospholipid transport system transporter-binding protein